MEGSGIFEVDFAPSHGPANAVRAIPLSNEASHWLFTIWIIFKASDWLFRNWILFNLSSVASPVS